MRPAPIVTLQLAGGATAAISELYIAATYTDWATSVVNEHINLMEVRSRLSQAEQIWPSFPAHAVLPDNQSQPGPEALPRYTMLLLLEVSGQEQGSMTTYLVLVAYQNDLSPLIAEGTLESIRTLPWRELGSTRTTSP